MNRKLLALLAVAAALFAGAYVGSPFWAAWRLQQAAARADADALARAVDFPAVRADLKAQLATATTAWLGRDAALRDTPFAGLGKLLVPGIVGPLVEGFVTPAGLSALITRGRPQPGARAAATTSRAEPAIHHAYAYRTLDRFVVTIRPRGAPDDRASRLVLDRHGLFGWKLTRLELPDGLLAGGQP